MIKLIIVADDFTGGLDTGVQFAAKGISTRVVTNPKADYEKAADGSEVLVVVAETRHLPAQQAYDMVYEVVEKAARINIPHIYKKTDSALRGNIGAELSAALKASGRKTLAFLPAMPGIHRTTVRGIQYIDGVPVSKSVFGKDPFDPVTESRVSHVLAQQSDVPTWHATPDRLPDEAGVMIVDAQTDEDLYQAGRKLADQGRLGVMAGCAGFAAVLPDLLGLTKGELPHLPQLDPGLFVLCGSVNPITQHQLDWAENHGFARMHIRPDQKLNADYFNTSEGLVALESWCTANVDAPWLILDANDADPSNAESAQYARERNMNTEDMRQCISGALGRILPRMLACPVNKTLLITGGDTLLQCMNFMGVYEMEPMLEVYPGVVLSRFAAEGKNRYVITKSGGFGKETLLSDLKALLEEKQGKQ